MKLRLIFLVLSLLAFLSAATGGYLYYVSLKKSAFAEAERQAVNRVEIIQKNLSAFLAENVRPVRVLAGMPALAARLSAEDCNPAVVETLLDRFNQALGADVCYLMDRQGVTVASSNRYDSDSFVGKNFAFRPYFKQAIVGHPATYLALGVTSGKRGAYSSHPVADSAGKIVGVAVIKASLEQVEKELGSESNEIILVTDPHGLVFIANQPQWLYHFLWQRTAGEKAKLLDSLQFGRGPWPWMGMSPNGEKFAVDGAGENYLMHQMALDHHPGWRVVHLRSLKAISRIVSDPLLRVTGPTVLTLCILVGLSVFLLYRKASQEIVQRRTVEQALRESKEELSRYSRDLERQVKKRTEEIASILKYTPAVVYIKDREGCYLLVNTRYEELFGVKNEEIRGQTDYDVLPREVADQFRTHDRQVLNQGHPAQMVERVLQDDGLHTYLSIKFPVYDETGVSSGVCGIATDITELKKAQDQLRRLSGSIMASQEKERSAIARGLHDELGQVLTAFRLDSVWLEERLRQTDPPAAQRASAMSGLIDQTIDEVRSIALRLRPGILDDLGLVDALEWYAADFERRTGITCAFKRDEISPISGELATAAYRIAQEALTNVARHADADQATLALNIHEGVLTLTINDDGRGFDPRDLPESKGLGVAGMRERAALIGGILEVKSECGQGTRIIFTVMHSQVG